MVPRRMIVAQHVTVLLIGCGLLTFTCIITNGASTSSLLTSSDTSSASHLLSSTSSNYNDSQPSSPQSHQSQPEYYYYEYRLPPAIPPKVQVKFSGEIGTVRPNHLYYFYRPSRLITANSITPTTTTSTESPYKAINEDESNEGDDDEEHQQNLHLERSASSTIELPNINYYEYLSAPIMDSLTLTPSASSSSSLSSAAALALPRILMSLYKMNNNANNALNYFGQEQVEEERISFQPLEQQVSINSHDKNENKKSTTNISSSDSNSNGLPRTSIVLDEDADDLLNSHNNRNDYHQNVETAMTTDDNNNHSNNEHVDYSNNNHEQEQHKYDSNRFEFLSSGSNEDEDNETAAMLNQDSIHDQYFVKTKARDVHANLDSDSDKVLKVLGQGNAPSSGQVSSDQHHHSQPEPEQQQTEPSSSENPTQAEADMNDQMNLNNTETEFNDSLTLLLHSHPRISIQTPTPGPIHTVTSVSPLETRDIPDRSGLIVMTPTAASNLIAEVTAKYGEVSDSTSIPGIPGIDYPIFDEIPYTGFDCQKQRYKGFFADLETKCQAWHYCDFTDGQSSFLCPNGTLFSQTLLTCDWWFNVKCEESQQLYVLNERLYRYIKAPKLSFPEDYHGPHVDDWLIEQLQLGLLPKKRKKVKDKIVLQGIQYRKRK